MWANINIVTGLLKEEHDMKLTDIEVMNVVRSISRLLKKGGTAIIFLDPDSLVEWQAKAKLVQSLSVDQWVHVSKQVVVLLAWF